MRLAFIHRGSATAKMIMRECGIPRWGRGVRADLLINYGLAGSRFADWQRRNPLGSRKPMFNKPHGKNKYEIIKYFSDLNYDQEYDSYDGHEITTPRTRKRLELRHAPEGWLVKPFYSQGGQGIEIARDRVAPYDKYFQQYIHDRAYELRVHAFKWIPKEEWVVQKRVQGEGDSVTWNHHTGGTFITVNDTNARVFKRAINMAYSTLFWLKQDFGGVDFIVNRDREILFIEINSAVGCHGLSDPIYVDAFRRLQEMEMEEGL